VTASLPMVFCGCLSIFLVLSSFNSKSIIAFRPPGSFSTRHQPWKMQFSAVIHSGTVASKTTIFEDPHIGHSDDMNQHWNLGTCTTCTPVGHSKPSPKNTTQQLWVPLRCFRTSLPSSCRKSEKLRNVEEI